MSSRESLAGDPAAGERRRRTPPRRTSTVLDAALEQLPDEVVRLDARDRDAHRFRRRDPRVLPTTCARTPRSAFLVGFDLFTEGARLRSSICPRTLGRPALRQDGEQRDGAQVAEITDRLDLTPWPEGSRVIVRRERPHPGAQLSFTDHDGHRFLATLTDLPGDPGEIERLHRGRANAEDRVRCAKQTGLDNLPFREFALNEVWLELSLIANDLTVWTQALTLDRRTRRLRTERRCATGCCTPPPGSSSTPAARHCASSAPGPGPTELAAAFAATRSTAAARRLTRPQPPPTANRPRPRVQPEPLPTNSAPTGHIKRPSRHRPRASPPRRPAPQKHHRRRNPHHPHTPTARSGLVG